jgi:tetratricopeptide (TPR) repeat protein
MRGAVIAVWLLAACRGHHDAPPQPHVRDGGPPAAPHRDALPKLPPSEDGTAALRLLDGRVARHLQKSDDNGATLELLLDRAGLRGELDDYVAAGTISLAWVTKRPNDADAWRFRVRVLTRVHAFADARAALTKLAKLAPKDADLPALTATIDEATGHLDRSAPFREREAREWPEPIRLTQWAASVALQGQLDDALAIMPRAAAAVHDNPPELLEFILFQWGRLYEQKGELATAREFFAAARARMPALEPTVHLVQTSIATGDLAGAKAIVDDALAQGPASSRQPDLVALAAQLERDPAKREALRSEAHDSWERYLAALPDAFSDHAARFYLGVGADAKRAEKLAAANLANRDTGEARTLFVEAAIAATDAATACEAAGKLAASSIHAEKFMAWRAYGACDRKQDAERLGRELGIVK